MHTHGERISKEYAIPKEPGNKGEGKALTVHSSTPLRGAQLEVMGDLEEGHEGSKLDGIYGGTGYSTAVISMVE